MKLEEEFVGRGAQFAELLKMLADLIEADALVVRGKKIELPDTDMEYKYSHKSDLGANKVTVTIEWLDR
ncbi:hypothetical protein [Paenibacillus sp. Soil522]|uniref:hypothetical protein n=1 Tax=Paenibacillus sp. Soil522 TaxID=1736388 RepID=UPI0006F289AE|nr:hypothetical protein [Paenibacillus sp. Soil522]KRE49264.1 hypothetical protein ASG81_04760 [Paenibacillus sp. Soil522]